MSALGSGARWAAVMGALWLVCATGATGHSPTAARMVPCPLMCNCDGSVVKCNTGYLTQMPLLPNDTHYATFYHNNFSSTRDYVFAHLSRLATLRISENGIRRITVNAFYGLSTLTTMMIYEPGVQSLPEHTLLPLHRLYYLRLRLGLKALPESNICHLKNLALLRLDDNAISSVHFGPCFRSMQRLFSISLGGNPLMKIKASDIYNLRHLNITELDLRDCGLKYISGDLFKYVPRLQYLVLIGNQLSYLDDLIFQSVPHLNNLILASNLFSRIPEAIGHLTSLLDLDMHDNQRLQPNLGVMFQNLTKLRSLNLKRVKIRSIGCSFFDNLKNSSLDALHLKENGLHYICNSAFLPLKHLRQLMLTENPLNYSSLSNMFEGLAYTPLSIVALNGLHIVKLDQHFFHSLHNNTIQTIQLCNNGIRSVGPHTFRNFERVQYIKLQGNQIVSIDKNAFIGAIQLTHLQLDDNYLLRIPSAYTIGASMTLSELSLNGNALRRIDTHDLSGYENLSSLHLSRNGISRISARAFADMHRLRILDMANCKLSKLHPDTFRQLHSLEILKLGHNNIMQCDKRLFSGLQRLLLLSVSNNGIFGRNASSIAHMGLNLTLLESFLCTRCGIGQLGDNMFSNTKRLKVLSLSSNAISTLGQRTLEPLTKLQILTLSRNNIVSVSRLAFAQLVSLRQLDLSYNPLACSCKLAWFRQWVSSGAIFVSGFGNTKAYKCATPFALRKTSLIAFTLTENDCVVFDAIVVSVSILGVFAMVVLITSTVYRHRWYIQYYYYTMRLRVADDHCTYTFDAYVAYSDADGEWVANELVPALENDASYRLCLRDRDWRAGFLWSRNIVESIRYSRKTIAVLSNEFAHSQWCRFALNLAHRGSVDSKHSSLILIMREDIAPENLTSNLPTILMTNKYLSWPVNDPSKQAKFWKALRRQLLSSRQTHRPLQTLHLNNE